MIFAKRHFLFLGAMVLLLAGSIALAAHKEMNRPLPVAVPEDTAVRVSLDRAFLVIRAGPEIILTRR